MAGRRPPHAERPEVRQPGVHAQSALMVSLACRARSICRTTSWPRLTTTCWIAAAQSANGRSPNSSARSRANPISSGRAEGLRRVPRRAHCCRRTTPRCICRRGRRMWTPARSPSGSAISGRHTGTCGVPTPTTRYGKAKKELETSVTRLNAGQRTRMATDFNESKAASDRATAILRPLEGSLNSAVEAVSSVQRQSRDVEQIIAGAEATNDAIEGHQGVVDRRDAGLSQERARADRPGARTSDSRPEDAEPGHRWRSAQVRAIGIGDPPASARAGEESCPRSARAAVGRGDQSRGRSVLTHFLGDHRIGSPLRAEAGASCSRR